MILWRFEIHWSEPLRGGGRCGVESASARQIFVNNLHAGKEQMNVKRLPVALRTLPNKPRKIAYGWRICDQYIVDENGDVVCQWASYTTKKNALKIVRWSRADGRKRRRST